MATHTVQNQNWNVNQLNARLSTVQQGDILRLQNCTLSETMDGTLFVPTRVPVNVDLEFENTTFVGQHYFQQERKGRLVFSNCTITGHRFEVSKSREGYVNFNGSTKIAHGISFVECEKVSIYIAADARFEIHPEWWMPLEHAQHASRSLNLSVRESSGGVSVKGCGIPLVFQVWGCELAGIDLEIDNIKHFELLQTEVKSLSLVWKSIGRIAVGGSVVSYSNIPLIKILNLPFAVSAMANGIDSASLEVLAQTFKRNGDIAGFVQMISRAGQATSTVRKSSLLIEFKKTNWKDFKKKVSLTMALTSNFLTNQLINRWLKRFYSPGRVFITQVAFVVLFAFIYWCNRDLVVIAGNKPTAITEPTEALYFSSVTFLTIGYGDIIPKDWLQLVASGEGFLGLILGLILAVVASRRYSS